MQRTPERVSVSRAMALGERNPWLPGGCKLRAFGNFLARAVCWQSPGGITSEKNLFVIWEVPENSRSSLGEKVKVVNWLF